MEGDGDGLEAAVPAHLLDLDEGHELLDVVLDLGEADQIVQFLHGIRLRLFFFLLRLSRGHGPGCLYCLACAGLRRPEGPRVSPACICRIQAGEVGKELSVGSGHQGGVNIRQVLSGIREAASRTRAGPGSFPRHGGHPVVERIVQKGLHLPEGVIGPLQRIRPGIERGGDLPSPGLQGIDPVPEGRSFFIPPSGGLFFRPGCGISEGQPGLFRGPVCSITALFSKKIPVCALKKLFFHGLKSFQTFFFFFHIRFFQQSHLLLSSNDIRKLCPERRTRQWKRGSSSSNAES